MTGRTDHAPAVIQVNAAVDLRGPNGIAAGIKGVWIE
jgi:hypothetical protein